MHVMQGLRAPRPGPRRLSLLARSGSARRPVVGVVCFSKQRPPPRGYGPDARRAAPTTARGGGVAPALPSGRPSRLAPRPLRQEGRAARDHRPRVPLRRRPTLSTSSQRTPNSCAGWRGGEAASVTPRGVWGYTSLRSSRTSAAARGCVGSAPGTGMEARSSPSYNVSYGLRSLSASSRSPRTIPNTAWRIVAWPKARRLAVSFGSSLRAGW
jgi:hypothetical protein